MFKEEIEDLKNSYLTRLVLHHVFSDEHTDAPLNMGLMNRDKIGEFLRALVPAKGIDHAFVCGPYQMNDEAEAALLGSRRAGGAHPHRALRHRAAGRAGGGRGDARGRSPATPRRAR